MKNAFGEHSDELGVIFLGFCERAAHVREGNTDVFKWNVLGLKNIVLSHLFPLSLNGWTMAFMLRSAIKTEKRKLRITDEHENEMGVVDLFLQELSAKPGQSFLKHNRPVVIAARHGWIPVFLTLRNANIIVSRPGTYFISLARDGRPERIGEVHFAVIDPPPLTPERIAAIRSDPLASKAVRIEVGCKKCQQKFRAYTALERSDKQEEEGWSWYKDIPDKFKCDCGATTIDLSIVRRNLHGLLGRRSGDDEEVSFIPLYETNALESIRSDFALLLESRPKEETLQKFIEENPILLHQFPSTRILFKPQILTFFVADFAILTPKKELILVELEKSTARLMKKKGGVAAPLNCAFDQVRDWLQVTDDHRLAVLDSLRIEKDLVGSVRGVVIAGRDEGYDAKHLRTLKATDWGRISLLTYDDLAFALGALIREMASL